MRNPTSWLQIWCSFWAVGYVAALIYLPRPWSAIPICSILWPMAGLVFSIVFHVLKTGRFPTKAFGKIAVYERTSFGYWFFVLLFTLIALGTVWFPLWLTFGIPDTIPNPS